MIRLLLAALALLLLLIVWVGWLYQPAEGKSRPRWATGKALWCSLIGVIGVIIGVLVFFVIQSDKREAPYAPFNALEKNMLQQKHNTTGNK